MTFEETHARQLMFSEPVRFLDLIWIYPVRFAQIHLFKFGTASLLYDVLSCRDLRLAALPRLYFLTDVLSHENDGEYLGQHPDMADLFQSLNIMLGLVLKQQKFEFRRAGKHWYLRIYALESRTGKARFAEVKGREFEALREIILKQNGVDYSDEFIHEDLKKRMREDEQVLGTGERFTDEDCMEGVMLGLGITDEAALQNMTVRRYTRLLEKVLSRENYNLQTAASMSGFVKFESEIPHWLAHKNKGAGLERYFKKA